MSASSSKKVLRMVVWFAIGASYGYVPTSVADESAADPVTGLPLMPGRTPSKDPIDIGICNKKAQVNLYYPSVNQPQTMAQGIAWFKAHLAGFHYVHSVKDGVPQDAFFSPDGTRAVAITGMKDNANVYAFNYLKLAQGLHLSEHEENTCA